MNKYHAIEPVELNSGIDFVSRADVEVGMDSPATDFMHDFCLEPPAVIDERADVAEALTLMERAHKRFRLVVDSQDHLKGILTYENLREPRVLAKASELGISPGKLPITYVMTPASFLHAVPFRRVRTALVGDVVETLKRCGDRNLIVTQGHGKIRGLILAAELVDQLQIELDIQPQPHTVVEILDAIRH